MKKLHRSLLLILLCWMVTFPASVHAQSPVITNIAAGDVAGLIAAINAANSNGVDDIINLSPGTYTLTTVDNYHIGSNGLPVITAPLTINGNGAVIERSSTAGTPDFRIFLLESKTTLDNLTIRNGVASGSLGWGGGIYLNIGWGTEIKNSTIVNNTAMEGGGIYAFDTMFITNSVISDNVSLSSYAYTGGGGIFALDLRLTRSTVTGNTAYSSGGGIYGYYFIAVDSTISNNTAVNGGGIYEYIMMMSLTNTTVSGNTASEKGGGIWTEPGGDLTYLSNTTITGNTAVEGGGLYGGNSLHPRNSIIAQNSGGDCAGDWMEDFIPSGLNIDSDGTCQQLFLTNFVTADPMLGPLQDNGGFTLTHALLPGSPAIDAVPDGLCRRKDVFQNTPIVTDQRGEARPQDGNGDNLALCDIGAYEAPSEDADGVSGTIEEGAPNNGDGNGDGIPDTQQSNVTSLPNAVDSQYVTFASATGTQFSNVVASPVPGNAPPGVDFPFGIFDFNLNGVSTDTVSVTLFLPAGETADAYYKYGPTPDNPTDHWYDFTYDGTTGAVINGDRVTLYFKDGLRGDSDLVVNGTIADPGAPVLILNQPPVCTGAYPDIDFLWPPDHRIVAIHVQGITDADGDTVTFTINSIHQDEPTNGTGDGDTSPDGFGVGTSSLQLRAERAGSGDGRVYTIGFTASDGHGGNCTGTIKVGVKDSMGKKGNAIDGGPLYDSTIP